MEAHFAGDSVSPNEVWRIYVRGSDADGDLEHIHVWLHMAGRAFTPARVSVAPGDSGKVSGFLALNTFEFGADENLFRRPVRLLVTLEDRAGHRSETAIVAAQFYQGARQQEPPQGAFDERFLGRIPLEFIPKDSTGGDEDLRPGRIR
jgi:hypothetical protein